MTDEPAKPIKVLVVDDSAVIRAVIVRTLTPHPEIEVAGTAQNGEAAIRAVKLLKPDIVILDIEMPVMDGITALPHILAEKPDVRVLICSTLSARGTDISIKALSLGATECILKPGGDSISSAQDFQQSLVGTIKALGKYLHKKVPPAITTTGSSTAPKAPFTLRPNMQMLPPRILAIGSSTGGPKALMDILKDLKNLPVPIVITQHMPKTFTTILAQHIEQNCGIPCHEGAEGMILRPGCAYVAPGGYHMLLKQNGADTVIHLDEGPVENFCRPSVDPMLRSLLPIYGGRIMTLILTGMGSDGLEGSRLVVAQGSQVIAQDEASSVVWGMPGAVAMAGICTSVLPLNKLAERIRQAFEGRTLRSLQS